MKWTHGEPSALVPEPPHSVQTEFMQKILLSSDVHGTYGKSGAGTVGDEGYGYGTWGVHGGGEENSSFSGIISQSPLIVMVSPVLMFLSFICSPLN